VSAANSARRLAVPLVRSRWAGFSRPGPPQRVPRRRSRSGRAASPSVPRSLS